MLLRNFLLVVLFLFPVAVNAADEKIDSIDIPKAQSEALNNKISNSLRNLTKEEAVHFLTMYSNYNIYATVKAVRDDVKGAVDACVKSNPSMKDDVNNRFSGWDKSVGSSMEAANDNIQNLALAQTYISQSELRVIFGLADELRAVNSSRFETIPVTTPEACSFMLSKMNETEKQMNYMLKSTLASYPNSKRQMQK